MALTKRKICIATGTRADWGLLSPLARALRDTPGVELQLLVTNMHLLPQYGMTVDEIIADGFTPDARVPMLYDNDSAASRAVAMAQCISGTAESFTRLRPDLLVILGDRFEMLAIASAATVMLIPIVHIAGGEISEGAIDDNIRHAITKLSSLHLTATEAYRRRIINMGEQPDKVINTGAVGVWNIVHSPRLSHSQLCRRLNFDFIPGRMILVTYHSVTTEASRSGERAEALLDALDRFQDYKIIITYPNNDTGSEAIIEKINAWAKDRPGRVLLVKSLGREGYHSAVSMAAAVVGNSSSGIVEVPSFGVCAVDTGIRQKGRIAARSVIHCGESADEIARAIAFAVSDEGKRLAAESPNPYYKPDTLDIMVQAILGADPEEMAVKKFYDINQS